MTITCGEVGVEGIRKETCFIYRCSKCVIFITRFLSLMCVYSGIKVKQSARRFWQILQVRFIPVIRTVAWKVKISNP